jgi:hypothetical protein
VWYAWERGETCRGLCWQSPKEGDHLEDQGVDGRMGSKWTLGRLAGWGCGVDLPGSGYGPVPSSGKRSDEPSGSGATELVITRETVRFIRRYFLKIACTEVIRLFQFCVNTYLNVDN